MKAVPKLCGRRDNFPVSRKRFEAFVSMSGCLGSLLTDTEVAVGDNAGHAVLYPSRLDACTHQNRTSPVESLTEIMYNTDLLDRVFARQSLSGSWKMLRD